MEKVLYTYALTKALYDEGGSYSDAYIPFVLNVIPTDGFVGLEEIQINLTNRHSIRVPLHVLKSMVLRSKKRGFICEYKEKFILSEKGANYRYDLGIEKEIERKINQLLLDIVHFFAKQNIEKQAEEIDNLILNFINRNIEYLREWLVSTDEEIYNSHQEISVRQSNVDEEILIKYIYAAEHEKPDFYQILQDMVLGSILSIVIGSGKHPEISDIRSKEFRPCQIFLDTNFVFSLFDLNPPEFTEPAKELLGLLKSNNLDIRVFPFTLDEICKVLSGYPENASRYPATIRVNTLYSNLKVKGWTKSDVKEFIANLERRLDEEGIRIDWDKNVDLENYTPPKSEWRKITNYKPRQELLHQNHDLAAIEMIKKIRGHAVRRIEDSKAFFLSSDGKLVRFDFVELGHRENSTLCEVLQDRLVANILWLKNPDSNVPLKAIIAAHSRNFLIDRRLWDRFNEVLKKLAMNGKVSESDISLLFYHGFIEDVLLEMDETDADEITPEFVIDEIEKVAKLYEQETALVKQIENEYLQQLKQAEKRADEEIQKHIDTIRKLKEQIKKDALKSASVYANLLSTFYTLLILLGVIGLYWISTNILAIEGLCTIILSLSIGSGGIYKIWKKLRLSMRQKIFDKTYLKKLKDLGLENG